MLDIAITIHELVWTEYRLAKHIWATNVVTVVRIKLAKLHSGFIIWMLIINLSDNKAPHMKYMGYMISF